MNLLSLSKDSFFLIWLKWIEFKHCNYHDQRCSNDLKSSLIGIISIEYRCSQYTHYSFIFNIFITYYMMWIGSMQILLNAQTGPLIYIFISSRLVSAWLCRETRMLNIPPKVTIMLFMISLGGMWDKLIYILCLKSQSLYKPWVWWKWKCTSSYNQNWHITSETEPGTAHNDSWQPNKPFQHVILRIT